MSARKIKETIEIEFLKSKTYTEINSMFNELSYKMNELRKENEKLKKEVNDLANGKI